MAIFTHIISTEHSGSLAYGDVGDYLKELVKQAEDSGEESISLILADYFSMTSLIPFYHQCTNKSKYDDKIKPVFGLKVTIQADKFLDFQVSDGSFLLDSKGNLIIDEDENYKIILDQCSVVFNDDESFTIFQGKKQVVDISNRVTDEGKDLLKKFKSTILAKPVFDKDHDVIVVAKGETGRRRINDLVSYGHKIELDSDYKRVSWTEFKICCEDLILITGGKNGSIEKAVEQDKMDLAKIRLTLFEECFNKDDIYLQVKRVENTVDGQEREDIIISGFKELSKFGYNLFACNDICFPKRKNYRDFVIRKKAIEKKEMYDPSDIIDITEEQYLKPTLEMIEIFKDLPEAIVNTSKLADKTDQTNYRKRLYKSFLPKFPIPEKFDNIEGISDEIKSMEESEDKDKEIVNFKSSNLLKHLSYEGLKDRWPKICQNQNIYIGKIENKTKQLVTQEFIDKKYKEYEEQIELELEVIHRTGFPGYFLIVQDVIKWCKINDIPVGPGRGSGAGSIVLYCLQITDIDSIEYDLLFERFLNPERVGEPDIDIDFSPRGRKLVIEYMANTYGVENTAQILTYGTMAAKDVVDNVGRVMGLTPDERSRIKDLISGEPGTKLSEELDPETGNEKLLKLRESSSLIDMILTSSLELEGSTKSYGRHAGGVVISFGDMNQYTGLYQEAKEQGVTDDDELLEKLSEEDEITLVPTVQIDKNLCEYVGLIKLDFLGLRNLDIADDCIKFLNKNVAGMENFKAEDISPHDKKALAIFKEANTYGIFQFESPAMRKWMKRLVPEKFAEIVALVALYRPGPLNSGMTESFVNRKHGIEKLEYPHKDLSVLLKDTYGTIIYQEQVMSISRILAGFTRGEADTLRKAMGKKIFELMEIMRKLFAEGAGHNYRNEVKEKTSASWISIFDKTKKIEVDINLDNIEIDFVKNLFGELNQEVADKTIAKFGYYGKFISTKAQVLSVLKEYGDLNNLELEILKEKIDLMKDHEFLTDYKKIVISKGVDKLLSQGLSTEDAEVLMTRLFVGCAIFVRFNSIFSKMNEFAAYGFNASHSVAYATISMQTAYLKAHHPAQYMAALLSNESNLDKLSMTARECRRMGLTILKPNINTSELNFVAVSGENSENKIRYGIGSIKGIAKKAKPMIERRNQFEKIKDIYEFHNIFSDYKTNVIVKRKGIIKEQNVKVINKTVLNALLNAGALDTLCPDENSNHRPMLLATYHHIDNTLTDLKKRLKKNYAQIKRNVNNKKTNFSFKDVVDSLSEKTKTFLNLRNDMEKEDFLIQLENKLIPRDLTDYNTEAILEVYKTLDKLSLGTHYKIGTKTFIDNIENLIKNDKIIRDLGLEDCIDKNNFNNSLKILDGTLENLSVYMFIKHVEDTFSKFEKSLKLFEKSLNKKTIKDNEKKSLESKINKLIKSDEYIFMNGITKILSEINNIKPDTTEVVYTLSEINEELKTDYIKFVPVFNIETELRTSHTGEDIEMKEFIVNGVSKYYIKPTTVETTLVPKLRTKECAGKEFEVTGMYQTTHPLMVGKMKLDLKNDNFNIVPLSATANLIKTNGRGSASNPEKLYLDGKVAGSIIDISDYRGFNERNQRMETRVTLIIDDGTGFITVKFTAEDIFTSGREDQGVKMLIDMKKRKTDVVLLEGGMTLGNYESEGVIMYAKKLGSANPETYLPVENGELNKQEDVVQEFASPAQLNFVKSLLKRNRVDEKEVLENYSVDDLTKLTKQNAGELITLYNS